MSRNLEIPKGEPSKDDLAAHLFALINFATTLDFDTKEKVVLRTRVSSLFRYFCEKFVGIDGNHLVEQAEKISEAVFAEAAKKKTKKKT